MCDSISCIGGECSSNQTCICINGWEDDNTFFHLNNCSLPAVALLVILLLHWLSTLPMILSFIYLYRRFSANSMTKKMVRNILFCLIINIFLSLSLYLENGVFEATSIFIGGNLAGINYIGQVVGIVNLLPILKVNHHNVNKAVWNFTLFMNCLRICFVLMGVICAIFSRQQEIFNITVIVLMLIIFVNGTLSNLVQIRFINALLRLLNPVASVITPTEKEEMMILLSKRVSKTRKMLFLFVFFQAILLVIIVGVYFGFNQQFPFAWCLYIGFILLQIVKIHSCLVLFQKEKQNKSSSNSTTNQGVINPKSAGIVNHHHVGVD